MARQEFRDQRQQEVMPERDIGIDPQPAARRRVRAGAAFGFLQIGQDAHAALVEGAALRRELDLSRGAVHQPRAQALFQACDQFADGRRRHAAGAGRGGKAAQFDDAREHFQFTGSVDFQTGHAGSPE